MIKKIQSESPRVLTRVLAITTSYPLNEASSSGIFVKRLVERMENHFKVDVICPDDAESTAVQTNIFKCRYAPKKWQTLAHDQGGIPVALRNNPWLFLLIPSLMLSMIFKTIRKVPKSQLVMANWSINAIIAAIPCFLFRKPLVTVLRGEDVKISRSKLKKAILKFSIILSDRIILVSHDMALFLSEKWPQFASKYYVITNGVEPYLLGEKIAARQSSSPRLNILTVGSLIPRKGIDKIISAINTLNLKGYDINLTVVGSGYEAQTLRDKCKSYGICDLVNFVGQIAPEKVKEFYKCHQVFVLASSHEGRPNVLIEAMAAGCGVIASEIDGTKEIITHGENGYLFPLNCPENIAKLIEKLIDTPEKLSQIGESARQWVVDNNLTWDATADNYKRLFEDILSK